MIITLVGMPRVTVQCATAGLPPKDGACRGPALAWAGGSSADARRARAVLGPDPRVVRGRLRRAHPGPGRRLGRPRPGPGRAGGRAHRVGQDPGRVPVGHRPPGRRPGAGRRGAPPRLDAPLPDITVGMRTGDTPADVRRRFPAHPPDILITTPESLFLLLTSRAREALAYVDTVIVDEVHSVVATKRGAHLALSLERLDELLERPARRIGLSATVRPLDEVARFLGGPRPVTVVAPPSEKAFDLSVVVPVEDMAAIGEASDDPASGSASGLPDRSSIWPHIDERLVELIRAHRSTIVFANSRRLAERLCANLNELAETELARAHHGSVSREQRTEIEEDLKAGRLPAVVATSSLELGIDMGAVDLVIQVEAPSSVASGLQRIGRA